MTDEKSENALPALPTTSKGWLDIAKPQRQPKLLDYVQQAFLAAIDDPEYNGRLVALVSAPTNKTAVEGSLGADKIKAADIVRDKGVEIGLPIETVKLQVIANKLSVMLHRFKDASRAERRKLLGA